MLYQKKVLADHEVVEMHHEVVEMHHEVVEMHHEVVEICQSKFQQSLQSTLLLTTSLLLGPMCMVSYVVIATAIGFVSCLLLV